MQSNRKELLEKTGRIFEPNFSILPEQEEYYENLALYFAKNGGKYDNNKGIIVAGGVGTGKTLSMKIMQKLFGNFTLVSARHLVREYLQDGVKVIDEYGRRSFILNSQGNVDTTKPKNYCFDDILLEEVNAKFYGNQQNLMSEILLDRYDAYISYQMKTYATTNANMKMIEEGYGTRVRDRIREMCNYITLTGKSFRK